MYLSIISPVYQAESIVDALVEQVCTASLKVTDEFELILVDDGSKDDSWESIERNCNSNPHVKGIKLSRNFGQHHALTAGLKASTGDYVIVLDCDLQDDPAYIPDLMKLAANGSFDIVFTYSSGLKHNIIRRIGSQLYSKGMKLLSDRKSFNRHVGNYSVLSRKVVNAFLKFNDSERQYLLLLKWLGFNHTFFEVEHKDRKDGRSSYNLSKLFELAMSGITYQSLKLLHTSFILGAIMLLGSFFFTGVLLKNASATPPWLYLCDLILLCTGLILMAIGVLGIYLGKVFNQVKNRPLYLIDETVNFKSELVPV